MRQITVFFQLLFRGQSINFLILGRSRAFSHFKVTNFIKEAMNFGQTRTLVNSLPINADTSCQTFRTEGEQQFIASNLITCSYCMWILLIIRDYMQIFEWSIRCFSRMNANRIISRRQSNKCVKVFHIHSFIRFLCFYSISMYFQATNVLSDFFCVLVALKPRWEIDDRKGKESQNGVAHVDFHSALSLFVAWMFVHRILTITRIVEIATAIKRQEMAQRQTHKCECAIAFA